MSLFKKADPVAPKGKAPIPAKGKGEAPPAKAKSAHDYTHPPLAPLGIRAIENVFCPLSIKSEGVSCLIDMVGGKDYRVKTFSGPKEVSSEIIPPTDRKKKAVTEFMFKGMIGIHIHPEGMVLTLDQDTNSQGQPRLNQPPLEIISEPPPSDIEELRSRRLFSYDLKKCTADKPLVIATNKEHMHMQIRMLDSDGEDAWGMFISSPKGLVRDDSKPVLILKDGVSQRIDRQFFTQLAGTSSGGIDVRTWNKDVHDPIIMEVKVDDGNLLVIEEMFTVYGLTILTDMEQVTYVGVPCGNTPELQDAHLKECERTVLQIRDAIKDGLLAHAQEMALASTRKNIVRDAKEALHKKNADGVGVLALELAVKEVLAPTYAGASGSETAMNVSHETLRLLNAITSELSGWVEADATRETAVAAIIEGIKGSEQLQAEGFDEMLLQELPEVHSDSVEMNTPVFSDVVALATRTFSSKSFAKETKALAREMATCEDPALQKSMAVELDKNIKRNITALKHKTLVRIAVKSHLFNIEKSKREVLNFDPTQVSDQPISDRELETILTRYDAYTEYLDRAYEARLSKPLLGIIKEFQTGANDEPLQSLSTKSFLAFLVALRTSGGSVSEKTDSVPAVSSLQALPDAIPDIQVLQPDPAEPKGVVRVVHREGALLEAAFEMVQHGGAVPEGVPNGVWFGFRDLSERIMEYYVSVESQKKRDRDQDAMVLRTFTSILLLKVVNLFRNLRNLPSLKELGKVQPSLEKGVGILSVRPGENAEDELLDVRNRPKTVTEPAMNIRHELRQMILGLEKAGEVPKDTYRFKQKGRSSALLGGGGKNQDKVALPITIRAQDGIVIIEAKFNDEAFSKKIRLTALLGGDEADAGETVSGDTVRKTLDPGQPQAKPASKTREEQIRNNRAIIYKLVSSLPFFAKFSDFEKKRIAERDLSFKVVQKGGTIIGEGTRDTAFFILIRGLVHVTKGSQVIATLGPGEMFGEIAFLTNTPRTMNIVAKESVLVLRMDQDMMNQLEQESREKLKDHIINKQVLRLAETTNNLVGPEGVDLTTRSELPPDGEISRLKPEVSMVLIDKLPLFQQFSAYEKKRIGAFATSFRTFKPDAEIIREGTLDTSFFIIIKGKVNVVKGDITIAQLGPGDFFGDMAFLTNTARTSSVVSQGEVLVMKVDQDLMKRMGSEIREKLKDQFLLRLTQRLLQTTGKTLKK
ncbi:MAG: cyclic nucleotide-binding domain-containing protein [Magnetococcales bacterium]|nr:cyclic nucleotide-binding domain-containing protein [Magnetococcales bacterium]